MNGTISRGQRMVLLALNKAQAEKIKSFKDTEKRRFANKRRFKEDKEDIEFTTCQPRKLQRSGMLTPKTKVKRWLFGVQSASSIMG